MTEIGPTSYREANIIATKAMEAARQLPHGLERSLAMRAAGQLQLIAEAKRLRVKAERPAR